MQQATLGKNMRLAGPNEAYTLTFGDRGENEVGMQIIGTAAPTGLSVASLRAIANKLPGSTLIDLTTLLDGCGFPNIPEAAILVVRGGVSTLLGSTVDAAILAELRAMPKDTTSLSKGVVINKRARHNNCVADFTQAQDIANGKGTVVRFSDYPHTDALRTALTQHMRSPPLVGELNHYFDANTCGIRWHGDAERKLVAGARFGAGANGMPFKMQWFCRDEPVGNEARIELNSGDVYILSDKAVGYDWTWDSSWSTLTLRHAAGKDSCKYARTKRKYDEAHPVTVFAPPKPLTDEQMARIAANKEKALAIKAAKEEAARNTLSFSVVGRLSKYAHEPLTVGVPINVTPDALNMYDKNAHRVWAYLNEAWVHVGFVDKPSAAILAMYNIKRHSARLVGNARTTVVVQAKA